MVAVFIEDFDCCLYEFQKVRYRNYSMGRRIFTTRISPSNWLWAPPGIGVIAGKAESAFGYP